MVVFINSTTGNGKTTIVPYIAEKLDAEVFEANIASLINKWRGESEKILVSFFEQAKKKNKSIIFFDEIDSLLSKK